MLSFYLLLLCVLLVVRIETNASGGSFLQDFLAEIQSHRTQTRPQIRNYLKKCSKLILDSTAVVDHTLPEERNLKKINKSLLFEPLTIVVLQVHSVGAISHKGVRLPWISFSFFFFLYTFGYLFSSVLSIFHVTFFFFPFLELVRLCFSPGLA